MTEPSNDRRSALRRLVAAGMAGIGAALAGLVGGAALPRREERGRRWRRAVAASALEAGRPTAVVLAERHADGWYETRKQTVVFIDREGDAYRALSGTCTHLGCRVRWVEADAHFHCPCHGGVYARDGRVVSGPPPRPLDVVNVRVNPQTADLEVEL